MCKSDKYGRFGCLSYESVLMQKWYVIIFLKKLPSSDPNKLMRRRFLYCQKNFSRCKLIHITQITSKSQYLSELPSQKRHTSGCPNFLNKLLVIYERVFRQ